MPKITVIIPIHNSGKYLERALVSLINQLFTDFEVLCIDNLSTDNTSEILEEFSKKDERIKVINNPENMGVALSRNIGIDMAAGEYIYFLDSDDFIDENYLECMVKTIERKKCDIILNLSVVSENNGTETVYKHSSMPEIKPEGEYLDKITIIHDAPCFIWARMYRKSFLDKYNIRFMNFSVAEDVIFNTITDMYCDRTFVFYGEKYYYSVNNTSLIGTAKSENNIDLQHIKAHSTIYDYLKEHNKLDDKLKLFRVYPFIKVDTQEKFDCYKNFFEKIKPDFHKNEGIYNELEKYFAYSLLNSSDYEEYLSNYNKVVTIGFLRRKKN